MHLFLAIDDNEFDTGGGGGGGGDGGGRKSDGGVVYTNATTTAAAAAAGVELIVVNCRRKRHKQHHQQLTNGSTILFTFTFPVNLDLFNLSTVSFGSILANLSLAIHIPKMLPAVERRSGAIVSTD